MLVVGLAALLGAVTGAVVLPDRVDHAAGAPGPTGTSPSVAPTRVPSGTSPPRTPTPTPSSTSSPASTPTATGPERVAAADLLTDADFRAAGITVTAQNADVRLEPVFCDQGRSLDAVAGSGPPVQAVWETGSVVATEQAITARDENDAAEVAAQVLHILEACQKEVATHRVYGRTHTVELGGLVRASWLGMINGELNKTGRAPRPEKISGGIALVRNGAHVAVFDITWCASAGDSPACVVAPSGAADQLAALSRKAARRLG